MTTIYNIYSFDLKRQQSHYIEQTRDTRELRDPPGQECNYIGPISRNSEKDRMASFQKILKIRQRNVNFEEHDIPHLARLGFYHSGYKENIKCFSCGIRFNFQYNDHSKTSFNFSHEVNCNLAGNIPMPYPFCKNGKGFRVNDYIKR